MRVDKRPYGEFGSIQWSSILPRVHSDISTRGANMDKKLEQIKDKIEHGLGHPEGAKPHPGGPLEGLKEKIANHEGPGLKLPLGGALLQPKNFLKGGIGKFLLFRPVMNFFNHMIYENGLMTYVEKTANFLAKRPYLTMPLFMLGVTLMTPLLAFVLFAFLTTSITFTGFLIAEGAILSMAAIVVSCFLLSIFGLSLTGCTMFSVVYFTLHKIGLVK